MSSKCDAEVVSRGSSDDSQGRGIPEGHRPGLLATSGECQTEGDATLEYFDDLLMEAENGLSTDMKAVYDEKHFDTDSQSNNTIINDDWESLTVRSKYDLALKPTFLANARPPLIIW